MRAKTKVKTKVKQAKATAKGAEAGGRVYAEISRRPPSPLSAETQAWLCGGMSQRELAVKAGLSQPFVCKVLGGKRGLSWSSAMSWGKAIGQTLEAMWERVPETARVDRRGARRVS